jgi:hypothetical protein
MKTILFASAATVAALAFMSDTVETVNVKGADGQPLRINKSDYDADQADDGAKAYTLHKSEAEQSVGSVPLQPLAPGIDPVAAPSAPDFSGGEGVTPLPIDPLKNAAAPTVPSPNQRLVAKEGTKFFVVDGSGEKITDLASIETKGYKTEAEAWKAIMDLPH